MKNKLYSFKSETYVYFNGSIGNGDYTVRGHISKKGFLTGTVISSANRFFPVGIDYGMPWSENKRYFTVAPIPPVPPFRDRRGRFAKPLEITLYLRELRVVPVKIMAASVADAEAAILEGDGEYDNAAAYPSALAVSDILDNLFEQDAEIKEVK